MKPQIIQEFAGRVASCLIAPLYFLYLRLMGYKIRDVRRVRRQWAELLREHRGPWLICPNHLTMIDSLILTYGLLSLPDHFRHYDRVPWNLPERANFQQNWILTVLCYLSKCLPVSRGGDRDEMKKTLDKCNALVEANQFLLVFPEGGRSRTGLINQENYSYGVGRFIVDHPDCRVLCIYLRGDQQETYSNIPSRGDRFTMMIEPFVPARTEAQGLRAQRDYAGQIIQQLARMEETYFANYRKRYRRSEHAREQRGEQQSAFSRTRLHA